jgi:hypothetical protein
MPVVHAELQQTNAGGSIRKRRFGTDDERKKRKKKIRRRNADRRNGRSPWHRPRPRLDRQAPIYRRSTAVLA